MSLAQQNVIDSLEQQLVEAKSDSSRVLILLEITKNHMLASSQDAFTYGLQSLDLSNQIGFNRGKAESLLNLAHAHNSDGNYEEAKQYCLKAIEVYKLDSNHIHISETLNFIGRINSQQGEYKNALEYKFKSLRILEDLINKNKDNNENNKLIAEQHVSLGNTYRDLGNTDLELDYYDKALEIFIELDDSSGITGCFNEIGFAYFWTRDFDSSLSYHKQAYGISMRNEDKDGIKRSLNFLGLCLMQQGDFTKAIEYFQLLKDIQLLSNNIMFAVGLSNNIALLYTQMGEFDRAISAFKECVEICEKNDDKGQLIGSLLNLSGIYSSLGKLNLEESSLVKAYFLSKETNSIIDIKSISLELSQYYEKTHLYEDAYKYYKHYATFKDSIFNEKKSKEIGKLEAKYELEKAETERKQAEEEQIRIAQEKLDRRNQLQYSGILIVLVLVFLGVFGLAKAAIPVRVIEGFVFFSFLLFFEFLLVFIDPYIEQLAGTGPAYKLSINAVLAAMIFPLHSIMERYLTGKVIKKDKKKSVQGTKALLLAGLIIANANLFGQSEKVDSLITELDNTNEVDSKYHLLNKIARTLVYTNPKESNVYALKAMEMVDQISDSTETTTALLNLANSYYLIGSYEEALINYNKLLKWQEKLNNHSGIASAYQGIGTAHYYRGNLPMALKYFFKQLSIGEKMEDRHKISSAQIWIGVAYLGLNEFKEAKKYYLKALKISQEINHKENVANCILNIGNILMQERNFVEAKEYLTKGLNYCKEIGMDYNMILTSLASVHKHLGEFEVAKEILDESILLSKKNGAKYIHAIALIEIALVKHQLGYSVEDIIVDEGNLSYHITKEIGSLDLLKESCRILSDLYVIQNDHKTALEYFKEGVAVKDSLINEEKSKEIGRLEAKYEFEKEEAERKRIENEELRIQNEKVARRDQLQYSGIMIVLVLVFLGIFGLAKAAIPIRIVEGFVFFSFLLFFEFLLVLLDPYIEQYTGGEPMWKLVVNAGLAACIFPLHSFFEKILKERIVKDQEKNRAA
ncbi:MAG: tetratricopeptide repeat protein [Bacteroidia bacterium]|nr:tetratricopeptide repeat protein [Bacteroidia bacterium]